MTKDREVEVAPEEEHGEVSLTNWEFLGTVPTVEQVKALLASLPDVWGVSYADFVDYVQALPQKKKVKKPHPTNPNVMVDEYVDAYTLYVGVAGRLKMLQAAAEKNGWRVDIVPEPVTPTGIPGYLNVETRLVFRAYVVILEPLLGPGNTVRYRRLGRKFGTAWVPASGGSNAAGTNPYEKVETSALGRALAAWGFGVVPGSGIASVEEMDAIKGNRAFIEAEAGAAQGGRGARQPGGRRQSRQELLQEALALAEEVRQRTGREREEMKAKIGSYLTMDLGIEGAYDTASGEIDWSKVKDGQIALLANSFRTTLRRMAEAESPI